MPAGLSVGKIYIAAIVMLIVAFILTGIVYRSGDTAAAENYNTTYNNGSSVFNSRIYNPLVNQTNSSLALSNNLPASSAQAGFSFAFVLTGFGNVITSLVQIPKVEGSFLAIEIGSLGLVTGVNNSLTQVLTTGILEIFLGFIFILAVSSWQKFPLWS